MTVNIRPAKSIEDWDFIRKAWSATYWIGGKDMQAHDDHPGADKEHFFEEMSRLFAAIMPTAQARMGVDPKDDDNRLAFAVFTGDELRFVYVMQDFRKMGIVPDLLKGLDIRRYTFTTFQGDRRIKPRERGWKYTPRYTLGS